jgi:acetyl-CoA carboxylase biotin carboxyl carrier protein
MTAMDRFSDDDIQWVLDMLVEEHLAEIEVEDGDRTISVKAFGAQMPASAIGVHPTPSAPSEDSQELPDHMMPVLAPVTGTFYAAPSPDAKPYVSVGDVVEVGDTIGLIEAMKLYHDVTAPIRGTIAEVRAENAEHIEADQPLFIINRTM